MKISLSDTTMSKDFGVITITPETEAEMYQYKALLEQTKKLKLKHHTYDARFTGSESWGLGLHVGLVKE